MCTITFRKIAFNNYYVQSFYRAVVPSYNLNSVSEDLQAELILITNIDCIQQFRENKAQLKIMMARKKGLNF